MANNADQRTILRTLALTAIGTTSINLVKFPNRPTINIDNGQPTTPNNEQWIMVSWLPGVANFYSYGTAGKNIVNGVLSYTIFTPKGANDKDANDVADLLSDATSNKTLFEGNFQLDTLQSSVGPSPDEDVWYGVIVDTAFRAMHLR